MGLREDVGTSREPTWIWSGSCAEMAGSRCSAVWARWVSITAASEPVRALPATMTRTTRKRRSSLTQSPRSLESKMTLKVSKASATPSGRIVPPSVRKLTNMMNPNRASSAIPSWDMRVK